MNGDRIRGEVIDGPVGLGEWESGRVGEGVCSVCVCACVGVVCGWVCVICVEGYR